MSAISGGALWVVAKDSSLSQVTKAEVNYKRFLGPETENSGPCMNCVYYSPILKNLYAAGSCEIVKGNILPYDTCDEYLREGQEVEEEDGTED